MLSIAANLSPLFSTPSTRTKRAASDSLSTRILKPSSSKAKYLRARFESRRLLVVVSSGTLKTIRNSSLVTSGSVELIVVDTELVVLIVELAGIGVVGATVSSGMRTDVPLPGTLLVTRVVVVVLLPPSPPLISLKDVEADGSVTLVRIVFEEEDVEGIGAQLPPGVT